MFRAPVLTRQEADSRPEGTQGGSRVVNGAPRGLALRARGLLRWLQRNLTPVRPMAPEQGHLPVPGSGELSDPVSAGRCLKPQTEPGRMLGKERASSPRHQWAGGPWGAAERSIFRSSHGGWAVETGFTCVKLHFSGAKVPWPVSQFWERGRWESSRALHLPLRWLSIQA